jgi:hypothetical protein
LTDAVVVESLAEPWIATIDDLCRRCEGSHAIKKWQTESLAALAGEALDRMRTSRDDAEAFLRSENPSYRCAAMRLLQREWLVTCETARQCEFIMLNDQDVGARIAAIGVFVRHSLESVSGRAEGVLAKIVLDASNPLLVRDVAYQALFQVRHEHVESWPEVRRALSRFSFPDDVDWKMVQSCAK